MSSLKDHIPSDVMARANKTDEESAVDWYAGRMKDTAARHGAPSLGLRRRAERDARRRRQARRDGQRGRISALVGALRRRVSRALRHAH